MSTENRFKGILNKKLKVFRVSPMYNFSSKKLKFYQNILNEDINPKKNNTSKAYKSQFSLNKNLRWNDHSPDTLQVKIIKSNSKSIYVGYFICCSNTKLDMKDSISLPMLLVDAKPHKIDSVHSSLCKIFDCDIQPVTFSLYALISFFVKLLEASRDNIDVTQEQVTFEYKIPGCEGKDKIRMSLFLEATTIVFAVAMDSLQQQYQGITTMEIILEFYNKILNHAYEIFKLDLTLAELQKISFPDAFLTYDGQFKICSAEAAVSALEVLEYFTPLDAITKTWKSKSQ